MKIAIINLTGGGMSGGYKKYIKQMIPRLALHPGVSGLLVEMPEAVDFSDLEKDFPSIKWFRLKRSVLPRVDRISERHIRNFAPDVIFIPTGSYWKLRGTPVVSMIRNMEPLACPFGDNPIPEILRNLVRNRLARNSVNRSDRIIAVSGFVKDFLITQWGVDSERIGLVYHGVDVEKIKQIQRPVNIPDNWDSKFLFTAGLIRPYRGLEDVIYACKHLVGTSWNGPGIVIAGETSRGAKNYRNGLEDWIKSQNLSSRIFWAGNLNETEMAWCYQNCSIFIMTSRVEACPNTALEAMSHGCISISSNNPPLPEIFGDASIYYPPQDSKALAGELLRVLSWDDRKRIEMSERAKKRAAQFSWEITAERTVSELAKAIECFGLENR